MKKINVICFYSKTKEKPFTQEVFPHAIVSAYPLEKSLNEEALKNKRISLIIVWDSSKKGEDKPKLKEIIEAFPKTPLFLIAEQPTNEYLISAFKQGVTDCFILPLNEEKFCKAIYQALKKRKNFFRWEKWKTWFGDIQHQAHSLARSIYEVVGKFERPKRLELAGVNISPDLFAYRNFELKNSYDLNVQFFGNLSIDFNGEVVQKMNGKKNTSLLAYLLFHHNTPRFTHREIIMDKFWREFAPSSAKNSLNVAICSIRKKLLKTFKNQEIIVYEKEAYCINPELDMITDTDKFIHYWKQGRAIELSEGIEKALGIYHKATACYKEEFLTNMRSEDWCESERDNMREIYLFILNRLSAYFLKQKEYDKCIRLCRKMLKEDECMEEVHQILMRCFQAMNLTDLAVKQYFKCQKALETNLKLEPSDQTRGLFFSIKSGKSV